MTTITIAAALAVSAAIFLAQSDKSGSAAPRKKMVFQPGEKTPAGAAADPSPASAEKTPQEFVRNFFTLITDDKIDEAYGSLTRGSKIAEKESDIETLKSKTREAIQVFGEIRGYEIVSQREIGTRLASFTCISLGRNFPLRWRFYFYRPADEWKLIDIRVDDQLTDIFDENSEGSDSQ